MIWFGLTFQVQCISIVKRKTNSPIEQQKCKGHEKRDRLLISKMEINHQISQRNKSCLLIQFSQIGLVFTKYRISMILHFISALIQLNLFFGCGLLVRLTSPDVIENGDCKL